MTATTNCTTNNRGDQIGMTTPDEQKNEVAIFEKDYLANAASDLGDRTGSHYYVLQDQSDGHGELADYVGRVAELEAEGKQHATEMAGKADAHRLWLAVGTLLLLTVLITIAGIGWIQGHDVAVFLPVISIVSPLAAAIITYYFARQ